MLGVAVATALASALLLFVAADPATAQPTTPGPTVRAIAAVAPPAGTVISPSGYVAPAAGYVVRRAGHGAAVADPHLSCGWTGCTVYLNKYETRAVATGASIVGWFPSPWTVIGGRYVWAWAQIVANQNKCIKFSNALWIYIYSGNRCS
jgi:hypothetical protein